MSGDEPKTDPAISKLRMDELVDMALAMSRHEAEWRLKLKREQAQKELDPGLRRGDDEA